MALDDDLARIAALAAAHGTGRRASLQQSRRPGCVGISSPSARDGCRRAGSCSTTPGSRSTRRGDVRDTASIVAMCELAEELAGGGDLEQLRVAARAGAHGRAAAGDRGGRGGGARARADDRRARHESRRPRISTSVGAATVVLERALGETSSPFSTAIRGATGAVEDVRHTTSSAAISSPWRSDALPSARMEGGFGFPFGGDPEDLLRGLREFAEQQAESVQEAQREQFATLTLNTAVELTSAALAQVQVTGAGRRAGGRAARRHARAVPRGGGARQRRAAGVHARRSLSSQGTGLTLLDQAIVACFRPCHGRSCDASRRATSPARRSTMRRARRPSPERRRGSSRPSTCSARRSRPPRRRAAIVAPTTTRLRASTPTALDANVSVKLTGFGLELDDELCRENFSRSSWTAPRRGIVRAHRHGGLDDHRRARSSSYRELRAAGHENVGVVVQAYLRRTLDDLPGLDNVRLCKGIYVESPRDRLPRVRGRARQLPPLPRGARRAGRLRRDRDPRRGPDRTCARGRREPPVSRPDRYEFQMLLGVRPDRADSLVADGHRLRVYVPYGQKTGMRTRCGASRRTRPSPGTSPATRSSRLLGRR